MAVVMGCGQIHHSPPALGSFKGVQKYFVSFRYPQSYLHCSFFFCWGNSLVSLFGAKFDELPSLLVQVIYKIKLPGNAILGEGKPENQNHAIIFTRGECLQTIDMNQVSCVCCFKQLCSFSFLLPYLCHTIEQEHYMEEALKMRNLLDEFLKKHDGVRYPSILGVREHIFTGR